METYDSIRFSIILLNIVGFLNYRIDQFIIAAMLPPAQLGFYVIAVDLVERLWILTGAVANSLLPHLANLPERDLETAATVTRHVMIWTGAGCLLVFIFADVMVHLLYSSVFVPVVGPLRWLLPGVLAITASRLLIAELLAREKIFYTLWVGIISTLVNIAGNFVLIPRMGISGAAFASTISYSLVSLLVIWFYLGETGLPWTTLVPRRSDIVVYVDFWRRKILPLHPRRFGNKWTSKLLSSSKN